MQRNLKHQWPALLIVASVFLFTGAIICMNDILLPSLKASFSLSYLQASLVQQSFYLVYLIFPIPIAFYISRYGYKTALQTAMIICSCGALIFVPAYSMASFVLSLFAVFVISLGVTLVNVAANPLAALLGDPSGAHVRVNFVQLFSRIGYSFTPIVATRLIYGTSGAIQFHFPYLVIGASTLLFALFIYYSPLPPMRPQMEEGFRLGSIFRGAGRYPKLVWGAVAMFFYMGAEAGTAGFYTSYLQEVSGFTPDQTATYLTGYYVLSTIVSLIGIFLLQVMRPGKLVVLFSIGMLLMYALAIWTSSSFNAYYLLGMGVFISIIFPSIFSMAIVGLENFTERGSALINLTIVGGAFFPPIQGWLGDHFGIQFSYLVPLCCFIVILLYGWYCERTV